MNVSAIVGRLTKEPELKQTQSGAKVCEFTVAVNRAYVKQGEERKADFFNCVAWRQQAEFVSKYFHKGGYIAVDGRMESRRYEDKNGVNHTVWELIADNVNFCESKKEMPVERTTTPPVYYEVPDEEEMPF